MSFFFNFYLKILPLLKSTKIKNFKIVLKLSSLLSIVEIGFCSSFVCCTSFNFQFLFQRSVGSRTHGSAFSAHPFGPTVPYGCSSPNRQRVLPCHSLSLSLSDSLSLRVLLSCIILDSHDSEEGER